MKKILFLTCMLLLFTGCQKQDKNFNEENKNDKLETVPYLSITESYYSDEKEEEMKSKVIIYDTHNTKYIGSVPYTSQYPLTLYSKDDDNIYYTAYSGKGDQVYDNKLKRKLTKDFCAFNYITKCGDKFFSIATYLMHRGLEPLIFDSKFSEYKQLIEDKKDDIITWSMAVDYKKHIVFFSTYSSKEDRKMCEIDKVAKSTVHAYYIDTEKIEKVYSTDMNIIGMAASDGKIYFTASKKYVPEDDDYRTYYYDIKNKKEIELKFDARISGNMEIIDDKMYFLGYVDKRRGIFSVDLKTKNTAPVMYEDEDEFINGFSLNYYFK